MADGSERENIRGAWAGSPWLWVGMLVVGFVLATLGALLWQMTPEEEVNQHFGIVWGGSGLGVMVAAILVGSSAAQVRRLGLSKSAVYAFELGLAALVSHLAFVVAFTNTSSNGSLTVASLFLSPPLGLAAAVLAVVAVTRGSSPHAIRMLLAVIVMSLVSVGFPIWLLVARPDAFAFYFS